MDEWQRRMKEEKDKERLKQKESAEMLQGYRGNDIREEDKKLKAMKEEERKKQQETAKILQGYRSSGISEEDRKLKAMKDEERKKHQEAESLLHSFKKTEEPDAKARTQRREEHAYPEPVNKSPSQQNDITYISPGSVAERKKSYSSQYQPQGIDLTVSPRSKNLHGVPFMEVVDEEETHGNINQYKANVGDETRVIEPESETAENTVEADVQTAVGSAEAEVDEAEQYTTETVTNDVWHFEQNEAEAEQQVESLVQDDVEDRFDVYFSFGIITDKGSPTLDTYMNAVSQVIREKIPQDDPAVRIRFDPNYQPYVIDEKLDSKYHLCCLDPIGCCESYSSLNVPTENYVDTRNRPDIRRLIITAAVPLMLSAGVSKEQAQQIATSALADAIRSQTFLSLLAKE